MVQITTEEEEKYFLLSIRGEVDASSSIELDDALKSASDAYPKILIDLEGLEYISSAGLGVFISYLEDLKKNNVQLIMYGLQAKVKEVFDILGLQHLMNIAKDKTEAEQMLQ